MMIKKNYLYIAAAIIALLAIGLIYRSYSVPETMPPEEIPEHLKSPLPNTPRQTFYNYQRVGPLAGVHEHVDIAMYVNGKKIDFSQLKYQLTDKFVHFEERRSDVVHKHATGITLGYLFSTLGFTFEDSCITVESQKLCDNQENNLRVFVNGVEIGNYKDFEFFDLDKILITYGSDQVEIERQLETVTDNARVFSKK